MSGERGRFISFEGIEGMGKTTALEYVCEYLDVAHISYVVTREPGGTPIAEAIRDILLKCYNEMMCQNTELLLMFASRAQNIIQVILPALLQGKWVLSDRFTDSSFAYQGSGRGIPIKYIKELTQWIQGNLKPDITFLLDAPVLVGLNRIKSRAIKDRIEVDSLAFFKRVREGYFAQVACDPKRFQVICANQNLLKIKKRLRKAINRLLKNFKKNMYKN
ncbi:thymidylate kinase [Coxiella endosymbiont of Amblyomma americanum]|nr:thymidylate kinase [Coxiella endosymbiont of Amblyomma americanum]AUJ59068.1 dTMP kinase [Coxiella-like endosymbiont of Amblyomma americanum]